MKPSPVYSADAITNPAYHLRYTWTGWPSGCEFPRQPDSEFFLTLDSFLETDGIRRLETNWSPNQIQLTCSVKPTVSPVLFTARIKGRLQHALRQANCATRFSRKVAFRTIGDNTRQQIEAYIANQVSKEQFADPQFAEFMRGFTVKDPSVRLQDPTATLSGRYWYNLHLVLVTELRMRFTDRSSLEKISRLCKSIADRKQYLLSIRSVMPDHLHLALRGNLEHSPLEIALAMMNNLAFAFGQNAIWRPGYYVGSFSEYDMHAVRSSCAT